MLLVYGQDQQYIHLLVRDFQVYSQGGINMKKINCYSKIASIIYLILFVILLIGGILPFVLFEEQENSIFKVIWIIIFTFGILFSTFCFFYYRQYIYKR